MIDKSINRNIEHIIVRLKTIPENPGVYQHLNSKGEVIYVGKARNLHRRVSSYFNHYDQHSTKIKMLVRNIHDIRITVTKDEVDALLLENTLIKTLQPRYNSLLKDDKSYPYLCITNEPYPRLIFTRNRSLNLGQYFGPYPNQRVMRELQTIINHLFTYRRCNLKFTPESVQARPQRPCMNHQIGLCPAPCAAEIDQEQYKHSFKQIANILRGEIKEPLEEMKQQMFDYADKLMFEQAEVLRKKIHLLESHQNRSTVVDTSVRDVDVYTIVSNANRAYINTMRIVRGSLVYSFSHEVKKQLDETDSELLAMAIPQLHENMQSSATEAIVPMPIEELPAEYIKQTVPQRGDKQRLLELSLRNATAYMQQCDHQRQLVDPQENSREMLRRAKEMLNLPELPTEIECFDNSNIQGAYPVAAMVHFTNGLPNKKMYRKFNIKTVEGPDDYASMAEVISRRYTRLRDEGQPLPNLLIVDGGRGQMEIARSVIEDQLHLNIPIAGLAKDNRHHTSELLYGNPPRSAMLTPHDPLFHLMERIQNEVHRFAITFHRNKRSKQTFQTALTNIPTIGTKTAQTLLLRYGSVKNIKLQSEQELAQTIGQAKAHTLFEHLNDL